MAPRDCPCRSGLRYADCCAPFHKGAREAPTAEALMRSRFAAFALGLDAYLIRTLSADHPDRAIPEATLLHQLARSREKRRFLDLRILHASTEGDSAEVLFFARIFERGQDRSFAELSTFEHEDGGWRYQSGLMVACEALPPDPTTLTRDAFLELARAP